MKTLFVVFGGVERQADTNLHLVAGHDSGDHAAAVGSRHLGGGERGRHDGGTGMNRATCVGIVEIERMREIAVIESGGRRCITCCITDHAGVAGGQAQARERGRGGGVQSSSVARSQCDAHVVQDQQPGAFDNFPRQRVEPQFGDETRQGGGF